MAPTTPSEPTATSGSSLQWWDDWNEVSSYNHLTLYSWLEVYTFFLIPLFPTIQTGSLGALPFEVGSGTLRINNLFFTPHGYCGVTITHTFHTYSPQATSASFADSAEQVEVYQNLPLW